MNVPVTCVIMRAMTEISSTAARSKRYRERKREGVVVAPVEVEPEVLDALTFCLFLDKADRHDRAAIGAAVEELLYLLGEGALTMDESALD